MSKTQKLRSTLLRSKLLRSKTLKRRGGATQANIIASTKRTHDAQRGFDNRRRQIHEEDRQERNPVELLGLTETQIEAAAAPLSVSAPATKPALDAARVRLFDELERIVRERDAERKRERTHFELLQKKEELRELYRATDKKLIGSLLPPEQSYEIGRIKYEITEEINEIDAKLKREPSYQSNNYVIYPKSNFVILGVGARKKASTRKVNNGWAYLSVAPKFDKYEQKYVPRSPQLKRQWEEDFDVSLLLHRVCDSFFPNVERVLTTPNRYSFRKELCEKIVSGIILPNGTIKRDGNLTYDILHHIIDRSIELIDNYGLFTLDLKPSNMGIKNHLGVFIDFSMDSSFLVNPNCDTSDYKSVMILILLIYCYNFCVGDPTKLSMEQLRDLARKFVPGIRYRRLCHPDYRIENDPCLDLTFNRRIAPSFDTYVTPETVVLHYSTREDGSNNLQEIIEYFSS
jgi:hypothetical protein